MCIKINAKKYYIKLDEKGVYTMEAFDFCPWNNIKSIELKRYMGYQTLFFEVKKENLKTKIKAMHKNNSIYYCLPLADCKGKALEILDGVESYFRFYKK